MKETMDETERRRAKQEAYNKAHGITPKQVAISARSVLSKSTYQAREEAEVRMLAEDPVISRMSPAELIRAVEAAKKKMEESAAELDFILAAKYRDEMNALKKLLK